MRTNLVWKPWKCLKCGTFNDSNVEEGGIEGKDGCWRCGHINGKPDPEDDGVPPLSDCEDGQCTIGWTPPPNTAVLVAKLKEDGELR